MITLILNYDYEGVSYRVKIPGANVYVIKSGDTLSKIAAKIGCSTQPISWQFGNMLGA